MYELIAQLIGFLGTLMFALAFQCKSTGRMIAIQAASGVVYAVHYAMLGAFTGAGAQFLFGVNATILYLSEEHRWAAWKGWKWIFVAITVIITVTTWKNWLSLLPGVAAVCSTLANWSYNGRLIRLSRLLWISPLWIVYDVFVRSFSGLLCESFSMGSVIVSIWRFGLKNLGKTPEELKGKNR